MTQFIEELRAIAVGAHRPSPTELAERMRRARARMRELPEETRPRNGAGPPGGLVYLDKELPTVIVPDVHARVDLLLAVLSLRMPLGRLSGGTAGGAGTAGKADASAEPPMLGQALAEGSAQIVFVGDYVHAEGRAIGRWLEAFEEFKTGYAEHRAMDDEMAESLGALSICALLQAQFGRRVVCLKGNHENIANERGGGNFPFGKFAYEGEMVAEYMRRFYSGPAFDAVYEFEKDLPLVAVGPWYLISHAEPARCFEPEELVDYQDREDVVYGLTWTGNGEAEAGSVEQMLDRYLPEPVRSGALYFGGHRPVEGLYAERAGGNYVQLHNPERYIAAIVPAQGPREIDGLVVEVPRSREILHG